VLHAHGGVERLLGDVLRLDLASPVVGVELTQPGHVERRGLDEVLVRGATAVALHALSARASAGERYEDKRRRNDADSPQDGDFIGRTAAPAGSLEQVG
jgi:hypothetical protein